MRAVRPRMAVLALLGGLLCLGGTSAPGIAASPDDGRRADLVLVVVVDQLAAFQMEQWAPLFRGGLRRLLRRGAVYTHGRYAYANPETAAGHTTFATGAWPNVHGIVSNHWVDAEAGREVYCYEDAEHGRSPRNLRAPTFADALRLATGGRAKTVAISAKDRAAIPLGGTRPTLAAWYDKARGRMVAGAWPGAGAPDWFEAAAVKRPLDAARDDVWDRVRDDVDYARWVGPDDHPSEDDVPGLGRTFPHRVAKDLDAATWRKVYPATATSLRQIFALATAAVDEEALGQRGTTDLLAIGVSTMDYAGHWWGPRSHEALDVMLRTDQLLGALLDHLDVTLGADRVLVVLSADHGSVVAPERARDLGVDARRVSKAAIEEAVKAGLRGRGRLAEVNAPMIYLAPTPREVDRLALSRDVAAAVRRVPGVVEAHAAADVDAFVAPYAAYFRRSYVPSRGGDVLLRVRPGDYVSRLDEAGLAVGSGHGSPNVQETDVPLLFAGPGVRPGTRRAPVMMTRVAPTLAALLGISPPGAALAAPLDAASD